MAAQSVYSSKQLHKKSSQQIHEMLHEKGINWDKYPTYFKRGTYIQKKKVLRPYTPNELVILPEKHDARANPDLMVERTDFIKVEMPPLSKVTNKTGVLFFGEDPITE